MTGAAPTVAQHNRVLRAASKRADALEERLAGILEPILRRAGDEAARRFERYATDHLTASALRQADRDALAAMPPADRRRATPVIELSAAAGNGNVSANSTMICVKPRPEEARAIADPDGDAPDRLHVTLVYLGQTDGPLEAYAEPLRAVAATHGPLVGQVGGYGVFDPAGVGILLPDVPGLVELRVAVTEALVADGLDYGRDHGFEAHITVHSDPKVDEQQAALERAAGAPLHFDALLVVRGDSEVVEVPLVGVLPVTASLTAAGRKDFCLPAELRGKTDPVRQALVETTMTPALKAAGLSFDVTNPFIDKLLASTASQITHISETTQLDVMRTIRASYDEGLSIPDTAEAIRAVMTEAAPIRARMIARTELSGAVNGASLAATEIVSDVSGDVYYKQWLTAPGAKYPRHEDYDGLDGQTATLDDYFDVGDSQLLHPGDPNGDPGEVINCFPAETLVEMPSLRAVTRRWYDGDLVRLRLASGDVLAGTPNHPILRADGLWVVLREVQEGDDLVRALLARDDVGAPDPDHRPAEIGETYRLAKVAGDAERVRLAPPDLHGDGAYGDVEVVALDRELLLDGEAASDEEVVKFGLALADAARARSGGGDHPARMQDRGRRLSRSSTSGVSPEREGAATVRARVLHPDPVRLGAAAHGESQLLESTSDSWPADAQGLTDREDALPALVSLTKVVEVEVEPFHGFVYNLDTGAGWYTAGSVACRNCRCTMTYTDDAADLTASANRHEHPGSTSADAVRAELEEIRDYLTAAGEVSGEPPKWTSPAAEEILPIGCASEAPRSLVPLRSEVKSLASRMVEAASGAEKATAVRLSAISKQAGGKMAGLDFAVKSEASLERKILGDLADAKAAGSPTTVQQVAGSINDVLRFTMTFPDSGYASGVRDALAQLAKDGYRQVKMKNYWGNADFQGIISVFEKDGRRFELQFHTPETFALKSSLHAEYEAFRVSTDPAERQRLWEKMAAAQKAAEAPTGALTIGQPVAHEAPSS